MDTIIRAITDNVYPETYIITNQCRGYIAALNILADCVHSKISHSLYFVDPIDSNGYTA